jgi:hypothetical protein
MDSIKMDDREIGWGGMDWIRLAYGNGPSVSIKYLEIFK